MEVDLRLMKALVSLAQINPAIFSAACTKHAELLLKRADIALALDEDRHRLRSAARPLLH